MAGLTVGIPLLVVGLHGLMGKVPPELISLPNRDYWLAPARRAETFSVLRVFALRFATWLLIFLCFAHLLVVQAHAAQPPQLHSPALPTGVVLFLAASSIDAIRLVRHFQRRD